MANYNCIMRFFCKKPSIVEQNTSSPTNLEQQPLLTHKNPAEKNAVPFSLNVQTYLGFFRDVPWALSSFKGWNWPFGMLGKTWGPMLNQLGIGGAGLLTASFGMFTLNPKYHRSRMGAAVLTMYALASFFSIIPWDEADELGTKIGKDTLGMSPENAEYFASIATGIIEALVQYTVISYISTLLDAKEKEKWKLDTNHVLQRGTELLLNIPGGAVWKIVFRATYEWAQEELKTVLLASTGVALGVAATTKLTTRLAEKITSAIDTHYQKKSEPIKEPVEESTENPLDNPVGLRASA